MVALGLAFASPKGKGVMIGIFLLIFLFLLGVDGAPAENGRVIPLEYDWDPANPPLWTMRPEDRERYLENEIFNIGKRDNNIGNFSSITPLNYTWDPENPPLWTIRPEDRDDPSHANTKASSEHTNAAFVEPCSDKTKPATLYYEYKAQDCPPKNHFLPFKQGKMRFDTCSGWDSGGLLRYKDDGCTSFCQQRTTFEWAQEVPFPSSDCHAPIQCGMTDSESVGSGWSVGANTKLQFLKAFKVGISGGWSHNYGQAKGKKWDIKLEAGECGYFTFVPVKKVVCGGMTTASRVPGTSMWDWYGCTSLNLMPTNFKSCDNQMWMIEGEKMEGAYTGKMVPDGVIIFVYTDCRTRIPMPMEKQDPVYRAPGVALAHSVIDSIQQGWVWNSCYFWNMKVPGKRALYIRGSNFKAGVIGLGGENLFKLVHACAEGDVSSYEFDWYYNGKPDDSPKEKGPVWMLQADVPDTIRPGCIGEGLMDMGAVTQDQCVGDKFKN
ncbi:hypothetical protein BDP81DRAFT_505890 [Colletotrichum phormii]|uniref:Uncharacterized protein n=1 Tax=Colletotrichum phormii TaxID=359342 RepID=A0AAI9ZEI0_9PEZI|nr:uncharacterized protein BDP81DRAFT_505890 [Colletotrichum phormii]KAK1623074.1 hypothetical protein BDP81DRAFT_505890 [Colletotrichum phormii]